MPRQSPLSRSLLEAVEAGGLTPPSAAVLARRLGAKPQIVEGVQRHLVDQGRLVRLPTGLVVSAAAVDGLKRDLAATGWQRFDLGRFKERFGLSRKWAIPLLEHLDAVGFTRRVGDERLLAGADVEVSA